VVAGAFRKWLLGALAVGATVVCTAGAATGDTVTFSSTQTIPVPPASSYAGSGGGDGWNVALTPAAVYNVFHHSGSFNVACHRQADATPCWPAFNGDTSGRVLTITDATGKSFSTSGHSAILLDSSTGKLHEFATRSDGVGGVICVDTALASPTVNPFAEGAASPFCGFTPLTGTSESVDSGTAGVSEGVQVGSKLFAFNFVSGSAVGPGAQNKLLCFDLNTNAACAGQPYTVDVGDGTNGNGTFPAPAVVQFSDRVIIPINMGGTGRLACFDGKALTGCSGSWPVTLSGSFSSYPGNHGAPFPKLTSTGELSGFCLPMSGVPCYTLSGGSSDTPANMPAGVTLTSGWNGASVVVGPRVYIPHGYYPNGGPDEVECYDYNLGKGCDNFPKQFSGLSLLYTINSDPQRPECLWVNADNGTQIQNFDAFTGGACGTGAIRVLASSFVVNTPECTPGAWDSLQILSPAPGTYTNGSVAFRDASGVAIPGASDVALDATGTAELAGLNLTGSGLPQFLITLNMADEKPVGEVVVKVTWAGTFDPACATKGGTTIVNPPTTTTTNTTSANDGLSLTGPRYGRTGSPLTFRAVVKNAGPDASTGVVAHFTVPAGATVDSVSSDTGSGCQRAGTAITCFIGTLPAGTSANVTIVLRSSNPGTLTVTGSIEDDHDSDTSNNAGSASAPVIGTNDPPPAPAPPSDRGTFTALTTGTVLVNGVAVAADQPILLKSGDTVDVSGGSITVASEQGWVGTFSNQQQQRPRRLSSWASRAADDAVPAQFTVTQSSSVDEPVTLTLTGGDFSQCSTPRKLAANKKPVHQLWGSAKGSFRTKGRYSAATVRGTIWLTQDRCDGTLTSVIDGVVDVADSTLKKTVTLTNGQSYLAKAKTAPNKPPKQAKSKKRAKPSKARAKKHSPKVRYYVVQEGDSLSSIATSQVGREKAWVDLVRLNKLTRPYTIQPGTKLKLPKR